MVSPTQLEILPISCRREALVWLRPEGRESWQVPHDGTPSLRERVLRCLTAERLSPSVVHSTSWRQEGSDLILLTHLAVVGHRQESLQGFEWQPVTRAPLARGTAVQPPPVICLEQVIEHALRHLAWLARYDPATRHALPAGWHRALVDYEPAPLSAFARAAGA